jgi:hypothetical protein
MRRIVRTFGGRSIFSGIGGDRLTVVRWDKHRPLAFDNIVLVTPAESREHARRELAAYHPRFVGHVEALLARAHEPETDDDEAEEERCPPRSSLRRGLTTEVVAWHLRRFGCCYPVVRDKIRTHELPI